MTPSYLGGGEYGRHKKPRPPADIVVIGRGIYGPPGCNVEAWPEICAHYGSQPCCRRPLASIVGMGLHIRPKDRVDARLITAVATKP